MDDYETLDHTKWECKCHVVFIAKCWRKVLQGELRRHLGELLRTLTQQKESSIEEGCLMPEHVHVLIAIPPKYSVAQVIGYIKGKSASHFSPVDRGPRNAYFAERGLVSLVDRWRQLHSRAVIASGQLTVGLG